MSPTGAWSVCSTDTLTCRSVGPAARCRWAVEVDGAGRYLQQRYVGQHQRRSGGAQRGPAGLVEAGSSQSRDIAVVLPRTRSRSVGHSATSSTRRSSRQASGWPTSPRQMMVSPAPIRRFQFRRRCRFISSTLRNGRRQPSSTEESDRCRSDQNSTRTFSRTGSTDRFSPALSLGVDLPNVEAAVAHATAASTFANRTGHCRSAGFAVVASIRYCAIA